MTLRSSRAPWLLAGALFVLGAVPGVAQEPSEAEDGLFIDSYDVRVVNVDVYVTDKSGNRITGLTADDFEVFEDGRKVAVSNFFAVENGLPPGVEVPEAPERVDPLLERPEPESQVPEDQRLRLVVYIDNYNIKPFSRNRVLREIRDFLRNQLDREDRVMLVTYDRSLHVRHPFTQDPGVIAAALQDLETMSGNAIQRESQRRDALDRIEESESYQGALSFARTYAESEFNDLSFSIRALRDVVDQIAGLPGRKALLYVSEGIPMIAGEDLFYAVQQKFRDFGSLNELQDFDASRRFRELAAAANANRITFYTLDAGGLRTYSYADASHQGPGQGAFIDQVYFSNLQSPLQYVAEKTGGRAVINTNRFAKDLDQIAGDFDSYYSLGYQPASAADGRYHRIEVKVKDQRKRDFRVRHREGYRSKTTTSQMTDETVAALVHSFQSNTMDLGIGFGPQEETEQGNYNVPLVVRIPIGNVLLIPQEETHEARLKLYVAVMDADGGMSEVQEQTVPISVPSAQIEEARKQDFLYGVKLLMRRGRHRVAVGIRDQVAAESAVVLGSVDVGKR